VPVGDTGVRDTGLVLQKLNWAAASVALAIVGVSTFTQPFGRTRNMVSEVTAFTVAVLTLALWTATERSPALRARLARLLAFAWAAMAVTCGLATLTSSGGPFSLLAAMATVGAGSAFSLAVAGTVTGAGMLAVGSAGLAFGVPAWEVFFYPLILALGLLFGRLERGYRLQAEQSAALLAKAEQLREEQNRSATLDERNRIAREIHDLLAHSLGALGVQIEAAEAVLTDQRDIDRAVELLGTARRMATNGLNETRQALHALHAGTPPLPEALAGLSSDHQRRYRAPVSFEVTGAPRPLSADAGLALTRTAQESLVNTAKHAPHQPVEVRLDYHEGRTALTVVSPLPGHADGHPVLETVNGGYGLTGMRERLLLINGSLQAGPHEGNWIVTAQVPQ
jgi:signal transduction histidine kinase